MSFDLLRFKGTIWTNDYSHYPVIPLLTAHCSLFFTVDWELPEVQVDACQGEGDYRNPLLGQEWVYFLL